MSDTDVRRLFMQHFDIPYSTKPLQELITRTISRFEMIGIDGKREVESFYADLRKAT